MESAKSLVARYARATAQSILSDPEPPTSTLGSAWTKCLNIVQQLAAQANAGGLTTSTLQDLAVILHAHPENNDDFVTLQKAFSSSLARSTTLLNEFSSKDGIAQAFEDVLSMTSWDSLDTRSVTLVWRATLCLISLLEVVPDTALDGISTNTKLLVALAKCYDGILAQAISSQHASSKIALRAKINIIDCFHVLFEHHLLHKHPSMVLDMIFPILDLPTTEPPSSSSKPFEKRTILGDYEATYHLSEKLLTGDQSDARYEFVQSKLKALVGRFSDSDPGALRVFLPLFKPSDPASSKPAAPSTKADHKGKAKAPPPAPSPLEGDLAPAITQILDILPDENPFFLEACLRHPTFSNGSGSSAAERVLGALLEGAPLPDNLERLRNGGNDDGGDIHLNVPIIEEAPKLDLVASRRNAFEDDPMDFSRLRFGKDKCVLASTSFEATASSCSCDKFLGVRMPTPFYKIRRLQVT